MAVATLCDCDVIADRVEMEKAGLNRTNPKHVRAFSVTTPIRSELYEDDYLKASMARKCMYGHHTTSRITIHIQSRTRRG